MQIKGFNIKYTYNENSIDRSTALNGVSFTFNQGDFICVVGKTGSGKSTLVQTLNALLLPSEGYVNIDEFFITGNKKLKKELLKNKDKKQKKDNKNYSNLRKKVGLVFQFPEYQLFSNSVINDVMFGPLNFGFSKEEAKTMAIKALSDVGLNENYYEKSPFLLSGGEKRRVAIAGILASNPEVIVLDEPTAGLDNKGKVEIMKVLTTLNNLGKTLIVITHDMSVVQNYAKTVIVMSEGKIAHKTIPEKLFDEVDLEEYSLEVPLFIKFKKLLKNNGFAGNLEKISSYQDLINEIIRIKGSKLNG